MMKTSGGQQGRLSKAQREALGAKIRMIRKTRGLQQQELARQSGLNPASLNLIESGRREPELSTLMALAGVLRTPFTELVSGIVDGPAPTEPPQASSHEVSKPDGRVPTAPEPEPERLSISDVEQICRVYVENLVKHVITSLVGFDPAPEFSGKGSGTLLYPPKRRRGA